MTSPMPARSAAHPPPSVLPRAELKTQPIPESMELASGDPTPITYPGACGVYYCPDCFADAAAKPRTPESRSPSPEGKDHA